MKPLTDEQIWGVPDEEMPVDTKDYFDYEIKEVIDHPEAPPGGPGGESD